MRRMGGLSVRRSLLLPTSWGGGADRRRRVHPTRCRSSELPVQLDERRDRAIAHLLVDAQDGRIVGVVVGAHAGVAVLYGLAHRLVLQRPRDAAAADGSQRPGVGGEGDATFDWGVEDRRADDAAAFARDPELVLADGRSAEPEPHPLLEAQLSPWHRR